MFFSKKFFYNVFIFFNFFSYIFFLWMEKVSKWKSRGRSSIEVRKERTFIKRKSDSPIRRGGRRRETFVRVQSRRTRRRSRQLTSWRWENKHKSNTTAGVDCWTPTGRRSFPTVKCQMKLANSRVYVSFLTKWMIPAAVNHTDIKIETNCAKRMELDVLRIFKYWRISGTLMSRSARRKRRPRTIIFNDANVNKRKLHSNDANSPIHVRSKYIDTKDGGIVK